MNADLQTNLRHNMTVNILEGAFFGFAMGFASFVTILPLFVSTMTDSPILIGLVPAIHSAGWQLPQLFTARWISRLPRFKPAVISLTLLERFPFLGLAVIAFLIPTIGIPAGLVATFCLLIVQGLGAGLTANPWQNMIGKIIPSGQRGSFFGVQAAAANLLGSVAAVFAGVILSRNTGTKGFGIDFLICSGLMVVGWILLAMTREPASPRPESELAATQVDMMSSLKTILRRDQNFRRFIFGRLISQLALIGYAFYTVYAVSRLGVSETQIGWMTGVLMGTNVAANVTMGWLGDRIGHRNVMIAGLLSISASALLAWWALAPAWFFLVFILAGVGNVAIWTVALSMTLEYGSEAERPAYVGMANTLIAPANILAPFIGGWLAQAYGYQLTFFVSALGGLAAAGIFHFFIADQGVTLAEEFLRREYQLASLRRFKIEPQRTRRAQSTRKSLNYINQR